MQQNTATKENPWFESGTQVEGQGDELRPVRSETRQPTRKRDDSEDMPKPPEPDDDAMRNVFLSCLELISKAKGERKAANDSVAAALSDLESQGMPREVTKLVIKIIDWDEPKREMFDLAYRAARAYSDMPLQGDMFRH